MERSLPVPSKLNCSTTNFATGDPIDVALGAIQHSSSLPGIRSKRIRGRPSAQPHRPGCGRRPVHDAADDWRAGVVVAFLLRAVASAALNIQPWISPPASVGMSQDVPRPMRSLPTPSRTVRIQHPPGLSAKFCPSSGAINSSSCSTISRSLPRRKLHIVLL